MVRSKAIIRARLKLLSATVALTVIAITHISRPHNCLGTPNRKTKSGGGYAALNFASASCEEKKMMVLLCQKEEWCS